ncbi:hypothetical protein HispidOSU_002372, partial [Sigmodon hispidus]
KVNLFLASGCTGEMKWAGLLQVTPSHSALDNLLFVASVYLNTGFQQAGRGMMSPPQC